MYISKIHIKNFRNFKDNEILFNEGLNVIIGHNNAGKSNLLKALSLVLNTQISKRLGIHDFNKHISLDDLKKHSPKISISVTIMESKDEDSNSDDLVTISNFLTKLESSYEALLTYEFFLPEEEEAKYENALRDISNINDAWETIQQNFLRKYVSKIWGGDPNLKQQADGESLQKFDFQFLDAIRDVERDMFSGENKLLKDVLNFFIDYTIKSNSSGNESDRETKIQKLKKEFQDQSQILINTLKERMERGKEEILRYATDTGVSSFENTTLDFDGSLSEEELFSALKLIVKYNSDSNFSIPVTHNGLGYNNLIFMSLLLARMQANSDGEYSGENAKVFPILAIEEPEAHLHPSMQYKFLKFLKGSNKVRQIFITTHSTHITASVDLDEIICLYLDNDKLSVGYPGRVFSSKDAKKYVQRFLDATKSDMLFAKKLILVEGIAEELLLPVLAKYLKIVLKKDLEDEHVSVINVGGRYFDHFLKLFDFDETDECKKYAIPKKVVCLTDRDPAQKQSEGNIYKSCYPFEKNEKENSDKYKDHAQKFIDDFGEHNNIRFFSQDGKFGKTFEYDLALNNHNSELLLTDSITNKEMIKDLMGATYEEAKKNIANTVENERIKEGLEKSDWDDEDKLKALIASIYLNSIQKGVNALELSSNLKENLNKDEDKRKAFNVPEYIKEAIEWLL